MQLPNNKNRMNKCKLILYLTIRRCSKIFISVAFVRYLKDFSPKDLFFKEDKLVEEIHEVPIQLK